MLFADTLLPKFPRTTEHEVAASDLAGMGAGSSVVPLHKGETYSVRDLWLGVFLKSGNDAVHVLSAMNGGVAATVQDMRAHAEELRALDTTVVSPDGYDAPKQVSSAYDLTLIARSGLQKKDFREYCATVKTSFPGETTKSGGKKSRKTFEIRNTNRLLAGDTDVPAYPGLAGVKNGNTTEAGATFTGVAERGGRVLLVTVMNPEDHGHNEVYKEAARLLDWGFSAAGKATPVGELVAPEGAAGDSSAAGDAGTPTATPAPSTEPVAAAAARGGSGGMGVALGVAGGCWCCSPPGSGWSTAAGRCRVRHAAGRTGDALLGLAAGGRPGGAVQHQFGREVDPQQQRDRHAEGAVHALRGDPLDVAAERQLEDLEAEGAEQGGDEQPVPGGLDAGQQGQDVQQEGEVGEDGDGERGELQQRAAPARPVQAEAVGAPSHQRGGGRGRGQGEEDGTAEADEDARVLDPAQQGFSSPSGSSHTVRRQSRMASTQPMPVTSSTTAAMTPTVPAFSTRPWMSSSSAMPGTCSARRSWRVRRWASLRAAVPRVAARVRTGKRATKLVKVIAAARRVHLTRSRRW